MLNQAVVVGRIKHIEDDHLIISVADTYKSEATTEVYVRISGAVAENTKKWCKPKDIVGVKGKLSTNFGAEPLHIDCEKVTFLSSTKGGDKDGSE